LSFVSQKEQFMRLLLTFLLAVATPLLAAPKYVIGVEDISYLPYYTADGKEYAGFARELLDDFSKSAGVEFEYLPLPINNLFGKFLAPNSKIDFKFPDNENWAQDLKKDSKLIYSSSVADYTDGVMVTPARHSKGKDQIKKLATFRGFTAWDFLGDIKSKKIEIRENDSMTGLLQQTIKGFVDGAYVNISVARYILRNSLKKESELLFDETLPHTQSSYKLSTAKHPDLIKKFDEYLNKHKTDILQLKQKWGI
jgi:ABC-type amino acid transport substrate-binding protein